MPHHEHIHDLETGSCENCGCAYTWCRICQECNETEQPEDGCRDEQCGCHTDTRKEL